MAYTPPRPAALRHRVSIMRRSAVSDGMGGTEETWTAIAENIPAEIVESKGGEKVMSMRLSGVRPCSITMRANDATRTISSSDRLIDERTGEVFDVKWCGSLDERRQWIVTACEEGAPA